MGTPMSPWKGRLRSHHATPQSLPNSRTKNTEEKEELQTLKKQAAPKRTARGHHAGASQQPRPRSHQSLRFAGRDAGHPIVIHDQECKVRADQSATMVLRRSPRLHLEDKSLSKPLLSPNHRETPCNRKTKNARKDKNQESQKRNRGNAGSPPRKDIADVSNKKSEKQELKPNHCKVLTRKRKRGTERRLSSKKQSCQDPKPLPAYCQETVTCHEPRKSIHRKVEKDASIAVKLKIGDERLTNIDENKPIGTERDGMGNLCGSDDWTKEQDNALQKVYFTARPSPHFWKRVSKMVPGKSAEDCFNRIHTDLSTPTPMAPRPRTRKTTFSPIGNFTLSDQKVPNLLEPTVGRQRISKQKSLAAQNAMRHLLQKHCLIDQAQEADHFSIFESSPSSLGLNLSFEDSPWTPDSYMNSDSLGKRSGSSSARKKPFSRLRTKPSEPSPAVLKPIKNIILHEKYIDQLSRRECTQRPRKRAPGSKAADSGKSLAEQQAGGLKAAKKALISEATDFISTFKKLQANSLAHVVENSEDDEVECDASDYSHDEVKCCIASL